MIQRIAMLLAAAVAALSLMLIGAVAATFAPQELLPHQATATAAAPTAPGGAHDMLAVLAQRDSQYRQGIEQANQRLRQAYQMEQQLSDQLKQVQQNQPAADSSPYPISPAAAEAIVQNLAPTMRISRGAELVDFQGTPAYEIVLDQGTVYLDAQSGQVISYEPSASTGERRDHDEEPQHDEGPEGAYDE